MEKFFLEKIKEFTNLAFDRVTALAKNGVVFTTLVVGSLVVLIAVVSNLIEKDCLTQDCLTAFIVTILVGTFIIVVSAVIGIYQHKKEIDYLKFQQKLNYDAVNLVKEAGTEVIKTTTSVVDGVTETAKEITTKVKKPRKV